MRANFWTPILTARTQTKNARIPRIRIPTTTVSVESAAQSSELAKYIYMRCVNGRTVLCGDQRASQSVTTCVGATGKDQLTSPCKIPLDVTKVDR